MKFTPGWSAGWYFVPFANLFKPYEVMTEIWQASTDPANWTAVPRGSILPRWWTSNIIAGVLSYVSAKLIAVASLGAPDEEVLAELITGSVIGVGSAVLGAAAALFALALVNAIYRMQMAHQRAPTTTPIAGV